MLSRLFCALGIFLVAFTLLYAVCSSAPTTAPATTLHCGEWVGTDYELHTKGCVHLIDDVYVVDATLCMYTAYILTTWNNWLYDTAKVTTSHEQFEHSVEVYGCTLQENGEWYGR